MCDPLTIKGLGGGLVTARKGRKMYKEIEKGIFELYLVYECSEGTEFVACSDDGYCVVITEDMAHYPEIERFAEYYNLAVVM